MRTTAHRTVHSMPLESHALAVPLLVLLLRPRSTSSASTSTTSVARPRPSGAEPSTTASYVGGVSPAGVVSPAMRRARRRFCSSVAIGAAVVECERCVVDEPMPMCMLAARVSGGGCAAPQSCVVPRLVLLRDERDDEPDGPAKDGVASEYAGRTFWARRHDSMTAPASTTMSHSCKERRKGVRA